jgi:hypothetical protein
MIDKIHKDDLEGLPYPDLDTKRRTWDFANADKLNELIDEIEELKNIVLKLGDESIRQKETQYLVNQIRNRKDQNKDKIQELEARIQDLEDRER